MLTELNGKSGCVCESAKTGQIRCPLIIRPTSEDVITGNVFQVLGALNPRWWLPDLLNYGLGAPRFQRQNYRGLKIELWKSRGFFPRELLPWREGRTEVDVTISWENPATTVFLEMKYLSPLSKSTSGDDGSSGIPSDQFIRNIRVGLLETGWYHRDELFESAPRDFCILLVSMNKQDALANRYRDPDHVCHSISSQNRLKGLPEAPFVGQIDYQSIRAILLRNLNEFNRAEQHLVHQLSDYFQLKLNKPAEVKNDVE